MPVLSARLFGRTKNQFIIDKISPKAVNEKTEKILARALECVEDGNPHDALKLYDMALKEEPDNPGILVDRGLTLQNMGRFKLAICSYDEALDISPENIDALVNKGAALHSNERYLEAIACYDVALKIDQRHAMALAYKGLSLGEAGDLQDAIRHFKEALSVDRHYELASISKDAALQLLKSAKESESKTR